MKISRIVIVVLVVLISFWLIGCAPGPNYVTNKPGLHGEHVAGFLYGFWHGLILPISFIVSLFNKNVSIYEIHNNGTLYNLGYVLGAASCFGSVVARRCKKDK